VCKFIAAVCVCVCVCVRVCVRGALTELSARTTGQSQVVQHRSRDGTVCQPRLLQHHASKHRPRVADLRNSQRIHCRMSPTACCVCRRLDRCRKLIAERKCLITHTENGKILQFRLGIIRTISHKYPSTAVPLFLFCSLSSDG